MKKIIAMLLALCVVVSSSVISFAAPVLSSPASVSGTLEEYTQTGRFVSLAVEKTGDKTFAYEAGFGNSSYTNGLRVIDVTDENNVSVVQSIGLSDFAVHSNAYNGAIVTHKGYLYGANNAKSKLELYPIIQSGGNIGQLDTTNKKVICSIPYNAFLMISDDYLFVGMFNDNNKMQVYDVSAASDPKLLGEFNTNAGNYALEVEKLGSGLYRTYYIKRNGSNWRLAYNDITISGSNVTFEEKEFADLSAHADSAIKDITVIGNKKIAVCSQKSSTVDNKTVYNQPEIIDFSGDTPVVYKVGKQDRARRVLPVGNKLIICYEGDSYVYDFDSSANSLSNEQKLINTKLAAYKDMTMLDGKLLALQETGVIDIIDGYSDIAIDAANLYVGISSVVEGHVIGYKEGDSVTVTVDNNSCNAVVENNGDFYANVSVTEAGEKTVTAALVRNGSIVTTCEFKATANVFGAQTSNAATKLIDLASKTTISDSSDRLTSVVVSSTVQPDGSVKKYAYMQSWHSYFVYDVTDSENVSLLRKTDKSTKSIGREFYGNRLAVKDGYLYAIEVENNDGGFMKYPINADGTLDFNNAVKLAGTGKNAVSFHVADDLVFMVFNDTNGIKVYDISGEKIAEKDKITAGNRAVSLDVRKISDGKYLVAGVLKTAGGDAEVLIAEYDAAAGKFAEKYRGNPGTLLSNISKGNANTLLFDDKLAVVVDDNGMGASGTTKGIASYYVYDIVNTDDGKTELKNEKNVPFGYNAVYGINVDGTLLVAPQNQDQVNGLKVKQYDISTGTVLNSNVINAGSRGGMERIDNGRFIFIDEGNAYIVNVESCSIMLNGVTAPGTKRILGVASGLKEGDAVRITVGIHRVTVDVAEDGSFEYDLGSIANQGDEVPVKASVIRDGKVLIEDAKLIKVSVPGGVTVDENASYSDGKLTVNITNDGYTGNAKVIAATYRKNTDLTYVADVCVVSLEGSKAYEMPLEMNTGDTVKIFIWEEGSFAPLCAPTMPTVSKISDLAF